jgi:hypothetical protein
LLDPGKSGAVKRIIIAEDHLGIRMIRLVSLDTIIPAPSQTPGVWWRDIIRHGGITQLTAKTDVRGLTVDSRYVLQTDNALLEPQTSRGHLRLRGPVPGLRLGPLGNS